MKTDASLFLAFSNKYLPFVEAGLLRYGDFPEMDCPKTLREAMQYSLLAPGKRIRPLLVLLATQLCGGSTEKALPAACAVEMMHAYSLIHDDLPAMDDDDLRRGRPTNHKVYGEAMAILAGDGLLTAAFEVLATHIEPATVSQRCVRLLSQAGGYAGMVGGQADDILSEGTPGSEELLATIHRRKTGALIQVSIIIGSLFGDIPESTRDALGRFGINLGLLFQIADDLLDITGDPSKTGKAVQKDAGKGKLTYPGLIGLDNSIGRLEKLRNETVENLSGFGEEAEMLRSLVTFVTERVS